MVKLNTKEKKAILKLIALFKVGDGFDYFDEGSLSWKAKEEFITSTDPHYRPAWRDEKNYRDKIEEDLSRLLMLDPKYNFGFIYNITKLLRDNFEVIPKDIKEVNPNQETLILSIESRREIIDSVCRGVLITQLPIDDLELIDLYRGLEPDEWKIVESISNNHLKVPLGEFIVQLMLSINLANSITEDLESNGLEDNISKESRVLLSTFYEEGTSSWFFINLRSRGIVTNEDYSNVLIPLLEASEAQSKLFILSFFNTVYEKSFITKIKENYDEYKLTLSSLNKPFWVDEFTEIAKGAMYEIAKFEEENRTAKTLMEIIQELDEDVTKIKTPDEYIHEIPQSLESSLSVSFYQYRSFSDSRDSYYDTLFIDNRIKMKLVMHALEANLNNFNTKVSRKDRELNLAIQILNNLEYKPTLYNCFYLEPYYNEAKVISKFLANPSVKELYPDYISGKINLFEYLKKIFTNDFEFEEANSFLGTDFAMLQHPEDFFFESQDKPTGYTGFNNLEFSILMEIESRPESEIRLITPDPSSYIKRNINNRGNISYMLMALFKIVMDRRNVNYTLSDYFEYLLSHEEIKEMEFIDKLYYLGVLDLTDIYNFNRDKYYLGAKPTTCLGYGDSHISFLGDAIDEDKRRFSNLIAEEINSSETKDEFERRFSVFLAIRDKTQYIEENELSPWKFRASGNLNLHNISGTCVKHIDLEYIIRDFEYREEYKKIAKLKLLKRDFSL